MTDTIARIVDLWSDMNPVAGYTGGRRQTLTTLFEASARHVEAMRGRIAGLRTELEGIADPSLRFTAAAVLTSLRTQLDLARPSGAGPSGTGMGGVWAAADGVFYLMLKGQDKEAWVGTYLDAVLSAVRFETRKWWGQDFTIEVRRECLDTASYLRGTLDALVSLRADLAPQCDVISKALADYVALFAVPGLDSDDFATCWPIFRQWDAITGPTAARGYPACLTDYYQLDETAAEIEAMAQGWLDLDLPVAISISQQVSRLPFVGRQGSLQEVWDAVTKRYSVDFGACMNDVVKACNDYGARYLIAWKPGDEVLFGPTPDYLVNLVTGGEDFAVNYLDKRRAYSQLYLTAAKNTSLLTMINILVHEASHGFNFVLSAKNASSPLYNLNTAIEVPMTEGMAFWREYQYWAAAQALLGRADLDDVQRAYLALYGPTPEAQAQGVLCAQLETWIWRIIRYVRALCDVRVNGGKQTYTDFITWAAEATGLSPETLHGECFTFLASPGYAPCYAVGCASYSTYQMRGITKGVSAIDFDTYASKLGFQAWPLGKKAMADYACGGRP